MMSPSSTPRLISSVIRAVCVLKFLRKPDCLATRRLRHYRSGLRALRRGRRPRQRGSVAQPEQHELSASRAASRRGAGEIHSRAAEQGRGGARRQALLPDHMSGEEVPSARQQFEGGDRADAFQGARIQDGPCATCSARSAI
ncbi:unnamed protein product [Trichogramma brassicae]|uniref:Uncharacterized protein n=1 Tax=Trichogramma brassicae TaxID=86971 RepID=A0A6H5IQC1_9HYME|nr:unnamed protein product [Trichogramma brassicae]